MRYLCSDAEVIKNVAHFESREEAENRMTHCGIVTNSRRGSMRNAAGGPLNYYNPPNNPRIASPRKIMPQSA
jgi:hypothetical protein